MANSYFKFRQFTVHQDQCQMKVTTDACLFGAWVASKASLIEGKRRLLDIGSGTGLLSLMIAQKHPARIDAIELQQADYRQSLENISASPFADNIHVSNADARHYSYPHKYDLIFSNPPFYENDLRSGSAGKNTAHHDTGLKLGELLQLIGSHLESHGHFYLLLPAKRKSDLIALLRDGPLSVHELIHVHPTEKHEASRCMIQGGFVRSHYREHNLFIKEAGIYSRGFQDLLKDYYLHI